MIVRDVVHHCYSAHRGMHALLIALAAASRMAGCRWMTMVMRELVVLIAEIDFLPL